MSYKHAAFIPILLIWAIGYAQSQDFSIAADDLRIEQRVDGGFHLFIRKKTEIASVLITETTRDPTLQATNYAYRAPDWNEVNGDEIRLINGMPLPRTSRIWSLIDSTPEQDEQFGEAFHIYIPYILNYGYETSRSGELYVKDGTYFNLRAFALPFADYAGAFQDNPFILEVTQNPLSGPPDGNYMPDTLQTFSEISKGGGGTMLLSHGPDDIVAIIEELLRKEKGKTLEAVICLDTTGSMKNDIAAIRETLAAMLDSLRNEFPDYRFGMVLYKDYREEYLTRVIPFTKDMALIQRTLNAIRTGGGKDIPEAVYEALYDGITKFEWSAESRIIILIGDAPPHPRPQGRITRELVEQAAVGQGVRINAIVLPQ
jgi:hypothetical protein